MKIAVVCAAGLGDGLLMQIAARHLQRLGFDTTTFSNPLISLANWFPGFRFERQPPLKQIDDVFAPYDAILLQHDNSPKAKKIRALPKLVYVFYGSHLTSKHGPLRPHFDAKFDPMISMAENIRNALGSLFPEAEPNLENGLVPPKNLLFRRFEKRIAIHPTSASEEKNWPKDSFLRLREKLLNGGWEPVFIVQPDEAANWDSPVFPLLSDLAEFLYESGYLIGNDSGPGHLASNLGLSTVIIGPSSKHLAFWRPAWHRGAIVPPPFWAEKIKLTRQNWKIFISVRNVYKHFMKLTDIK